MINNISFTSDYKVKFKSEIQKPSKKQKKKEENYHKFQRCCEKLAYGMEGVLFSAEDFSDDKTRKGTITLHVQDNLDSIVESYLLYNNIKFKKVNNK